MLIRYERVRRLLLLLVGQYITHSHAGLLLLLMLLQGGRSLLRG